MKTCTHTVALWIRLDTHGLDYWASTYSTSLGYEPVWNFRQFFTLTLTAGVWWKHRRHSLWQLVAFFNLKSVIYIYINTGKERAIKGRGRGTFRCCVSFIGKSMLYSYYTTGMCQQLQFVCIQEWRVRCAWTKGHVTWSCDMNWRMGTVVRRLFGTSLTYSFTSEQGCQVWPKFRLGKRESPMLTLVLETPSRKLFL